MSKDMMLFFIVILCSISLSLLFGYIYKLKKQFLNSILRFQQEVMHIRQDVRAVCSGAFGVGQRLNSLEEYVNNIESRQQQTELRNKPLTSYSHAAKIIEMGGSIEDVVSSCGLTKAEAELVIVLHQYKQNMPKNKEQE